MNADVVVENYGTLCLLRPVTDAGTAWLDENIGADAMMFGDAVVAEPRYVGDIVGGMIADGLAVR